MKCYLYNTTFYLYNLCKNIGLKNIFNSFTALVMNDIGLTK